MNIDSTHNHRRAVGTFSNRLTAEKALNELRDAGFSMDRVSIIARDAEHGDTLAGTEVQDRDRMDNKADEGAAAGAVSGGALGGLTGLLVGLGALAIPGVGPVMLAGAGATALATTLAGGAIGAAAGSLTGALIGMGIPEDRAKVYNDRLSQGDYLVMMDGTDAELDQAQAVLSRNGIQEWGIYNHTTDRTTADRIVDPVPPDPRINPIADSINRPGNTPL